MVFCGSADSSIYIYILVHIGQYVGQQQQQQQQQSMVLKLSGLGLVVDLKKNPDR